VKKSFSPFSNNADKIKKQSASKSRKVSGENEAALIVFMSPVQKGRSIDTRTNRVRVKWVPYSAKQT